MTRFERFLDAWADGCPLGADLSGELPGRGAIASLDGGVHLLDRRPKILQAIHFRFQDLLPGLADPLSVF